MHAAAPHAPKQLPGGIDGETPEVVFLEAASKPRLLDRAAASLKRRTKALPELFGRQASKARRVAAQTIAPRDDESKGRSYSGAPSFAATAAAFASATRREDLVYHDCIAHPDNDQGITEFEYYGKTVEEKAKEAPVRAERDPMGHRGALHDPYAAAAGAGEE